MIRPKIFYHFRRNRTYARHERWGVVAGLFALTLAVAGVGFLFVNKSQAEAADITIETVTTPDRSIKANGQDSADTQILVTKTGSNVPAVNTWIGLKVHDKGLTTSQLTYNEWYSPETGRAFFQTDARGEVDFPMLSQKAGTITYDIYTADIGTDNSTASYRKLGKQFVVHYDAP